MKIALGDYQLNELFFTYFLLTTLKKHGPKNFNFDEGQDKKNVILMKWTLDRNKSFKQTNNKKNVTTMLWLIKRIMQEVKFILWG